MGVLPVGAVAGSAIGVVAAVPVNVEDVRERRANEFSLSVVDRISDEVDAPLVSMLSAGTAVTQMLVERDHVAWFGLERDCACVVVHFTCAVRTRDDTQRATVALHGLEVG